MPAHSPAPNAGPRNADLAGLTANTYAVSLRRMSDQTLSRRQTGGAMANPHEQTQRGIARAHQMIHQRKRHLEAILDRTIGVDRFEQVVFDVFRTTPDLSLCKPESVLGAVLESAKAQLAPNTAAQYCWIVALNKWDPHERGKRWQAEWWLGYQGAKVLATRDGRVIRVWSRAVYENDPLFEVVEGSEPRLDHKPLIVTANARGSRLALEPEGSREHPIDPRGQLVAAYACAKFAERRIGAAMVSGGGTQFTALSAADILPIETGVLASKSEAGRRESPWVKHRAAMWCKTAIKRLAKRDLQLPDEAARPIELDGRAEANLPQGLDDTWAQVEPGEGKIHQVPESPAALEASAVDESEPGNEPPDDIAGIQDGINGVFDDLEGGEGDHA